MVPAAGQTQQCSLCEAPSAGISTGKDCGYPPLQVPKVAVGAVGVFSGGGCWIPPDVFFSPGDLWRRGSLLAPSLAVGTLVAVVALVSDV